MKDTGPPAFAFARDMRGGGEEPHVIVVTGMTDLSHRYNTEAADVLDASYGGFGWKKFMGRACDAVGISTTTSQVFLEMLFDRSLKRPVVLYVGNAATLVKDDGEELVQFIAQWEHFALFSPGHAHPMFLALQKPWRFA